jgi:hypothetical protein
MVDALEPPARPVAISTLCPHCDELCQWYRQGNILFGRCNSHGRIQEMHVGPADPPPPSSHRPDNLPEPPPSDDEPKNGFHH